MKALKSIAHQHDLKIIEDCSQSHGATLDGVVTGNVGDAAVFSLDPTKNLGALTDAGVVTTNDSAIADQIGILLQYRWRTRNNSEIAAVNGRLDEIQAAILRVKLTYLPSMNAARQTISASDLSMHSEMRRRLASMLEEYFSCVSPVCNSGYASIRSSDRASKGEYSDSCSLSDSRTPSVGLSGQNRANRLARQH
jgi:dTDP-4-amino-4,6-dideoxygalactose transaminase